MSNDPVWQAPDEGFRGQVTRKAVTLIGSATVCPVCGQRIARNPTSRRVHAEECMELRGEAASQL